MAGPGRALADGTRNRTYRTKDILYVVAILAIDLSSTSSRDGISTQRNSTWQVLESMAVLWLRVLGVVLLSSF